MWLWKNVNGHLLPLPGNPNFSLRIFFQLAFLPGEYFLNISERKKFRRNVPVVFHLLLAKGLHIVGHFSHLQAWMGALWEQGHAEGFRILWNEETGYKTQGTFPPTFVPPGSLSPRSIVRDQPVWHPHIWLPVKIIWAVVRATTTSLNGSILGPVKMPLTRKTLLQCMGDGSVPYANEKLINT